MKELDMKKIEKTLNHLKKNRMAAYFVETKEEALELCKSLIKECDVITHGGSETIKEIGLLDYINSGNFTYLDRSKCQTKEEIDKIYRDAYNADVYLTSSNAITEHGALYNVDGNSNRVSAILYGPKSVIVVAGYNKVVKDLDQAVKRVKSVAAPKNVQRLNCDTYCFHEGECLANGDEASYMCDGCRTDARICCNYVICAQQRHKDRIKVILVGEELGY